MHHIRLRDKHRSCSLGLRSWFTEAILANYFAFKWKFQSEVMYLKCSSQATLYPIQPSFDTIVLHIPRIICTPKRKKLLSPSLVLRRHLYCAFIGRQCCE